MDLHEMKVLEYIINHPDFQEEELMKDLDYSEEKVKMAIENLTKEEYLNASLIPTEKAHAEIEKKKPKNAIIIATGFGVQTGSGDTRSSKGLLEIEGERLIERLIRQLHEVGIKEINIVVDFLRDKFEYLKDKYGVNLVYNDAHAAKNNIHSLCVVSDKITNTYIMPSDIWSEDNPFAEQERYSWYSVSDREDKESLSTINFQKIFSKATDREQGNQMTGIVYISEKEAPLFREKLNRVCEKSVYADTFWEEALFTEDKPLDIYPEIFPDETIQEVDPSKELHSLDHQADNLGADIIQLIADKMNIDKESIKNITVLKKGMTNRSFKFSVGDQSYIIRLPGEGTENLVNRYQEYEVYQALKGTNISDEVIYMSPEKGYKITKFWESVRECDPFNQEDVEKSMETLRNFHAKKLKVSHSFDLFEKINEYENLRGDQPSMFSDYEQTKKNVFSLKKIIDEMPKDWALTHIDAVPSNFLIVNGQARLIDWEYAGMQDPHVDIAMFAISAMYDRQKVDQLIDIYFKGECPAETRTKIYCYIAVGGLLWSNWCDHKKKYGVEFGEYSLRQYQYAKEYYNIVMDSLVEERN